MPAEWWGERSTAKKQPGGGEFDMKKWEDNLAFLTIYAFAVLSAAVVIAYAVKVMFF